MYSNAVLLGNWVDERSLQEENLKIFMRRRDRKELLVQKTRTMFKNLLHEKPLGGPSIISYGDLVKVVASEMPTDPETQKKGVKFGLALSGLVTEREVDYVQNLAAGCSMTLSPVTTSCSRNTFQITSTDRKDTKIGVQLRYADDFALRITNYAEPDNHLYVRYDATAIPEPDDRWCLSLSSNLDSNCRWRCVPLIPNDRIQLEGSLVQQGTRLILKNCVADKYLCVRNAWIRSFFGAECGVQMKNSIDSHKMPTVENYFMLVSQDVTVKKPSN